MTTFMYHLLLVRKENISLEENVLLEVICFPVKVSSMEKKNNFLGYLVLMSMC